MKEFITCISPHCKNMPEFICSCNEIVLICSDHCSEHIKSEGAHSIEYAVETLDNFLKSKLLQNLSENLKILQKAKCDMIRQCSILVELINKVCQLESLKIIEMENEHLLMQEYILNNIKIFRGAIKPIIDTKIYLKKDDSFSDIEKKIEFVLINRIRIKSEDQNDIVLVKDGKVKIFDLKKYEMLESKLCIQGESRSSCILPNGNYFLNQNNYCYSFNSNTLALEVLSSPKYIGYRAPVFHNDFVYLIGGISYQSEKYSMIDGKWSDISNSPLLGNTSVIGNVIADEICVGSYKDSTIYYLDLTSNQYIKGLELQELSQKCIGYDHIFGVECFARNNGNINDWVNMKYSSTVGFGLELNQFCMSRYNGFIFFTDKKGRILRFGIKELDLNIIRNI